jgi:hypothetical protein
MKGDQLGRSLQKAMGVTYQHLKRASNIQAELEGMDSDMDYFVAHIEEAPRKLVRGEIHGTN